MFEHVRLDFSSIDLTNSVNTISFFVLLTLFIVAVYANCSSFMAEVFPALTAATVDAFQDSRMQGHSWLSATSAAVAEFRQQHDSEKGAFFIVLGLTTFAMSIVVLAAVSAASALLRALGA